MAGSPVRISEICVEGFRCFGQRQTARIAPLTLLVGENSAGKTSFLAMVRALRESAVALPQPDFNAPPYQFGSYDDMAHRKGAIGNPPVPEFNGSATFLMSPRIPSGYRPEVKISATYAKRGKEPALVRRRFEAEDYWIEDDARSRRGVTVVGHPEFELETRFARETQQAPIHSWILLHSVRMALDGPEHVKIRRGSLPEGQEWWPAFHQRMTDAVEFFGSDKGLVFPGAPVRSQPKRSYEATPGRNVAEGDRIPRRLADLIAKGGRAWEKLGASLRRYGKDSGLFDHIDVRRLGTFDSDPFQVSISPSGSPSRVLTDVGYGVSQALPVLVELLNGDPSRVFLLQQPEVHLHPRAQATLGSLMVRAANGGRQLLVETHSDYLLDRIRMDIRDGKTKLGPDDVSILYFERDGVEARIHSIGIDAQGNVVGAPEGYRQFFMEETDRSFGL